MEAARTQHGGSKCDRRTIPDYTAHMAEHAGLVVGVLGRYASEASQPFAPRLEVVGVHISERARAAALEALEAAWESTLPWAPAAELEERAQTFLRKSLSMNGLGDVTVQVTVLDNIPSRVRP